MPAGDYFPWCPPGWPTVWNQSFDIPRPIIAPPVTIYSETMYSDVTKADLEALRREIAELKELLKVRSK